ncbi:MAG: hypothetical protein ACI841_002099, partial [Planctomycetota bacterium]
SSSLILTTLTSCEHQSSSSHIANPSEASHVPKSTAGVHGQQPAEQDGSELQAVLAYLRWVQSRGDDAQANAPAASDWIVRLREAADMNPRKRVNLACRTQLIALLNEVGDDSAAEEQIQLRIDLEPDPAMRPFWVSELAEARLRRVITGELSDSELAASIGVQNWARRELESGLASAGSVEHWAPSLPGRYLVNLLNYSHYIRTGTIEASVAREHLAAGVALAQDWLERKIVLPGHGPWNFAVAQFESWIEDQEAGDEEILAAFERLEADGGKPDLVALHALHCFQRLHGTDTLEFAQNAENWLQQAGVQGPNGLLISLYIGRAYLANSAYEKVLTQIEPHLGLEPEWATGTYTDSWHSM